MLRPSAHTGVKASGTGGFAATFDPNGNSSPLTVDSKYAKKRPFSKTNSVVLCVTSFIFGMIVRNSMMAPPPMNTATAAASPSVRRAPISSTTNRITSEQAVFETIRERAQEHQRHCQSLGLTEDEDFTHPKFNNHTVHLPQSGIIHAIDSYKSDPSKYPYPCELPPETECHETQFTVIFMAYNPDRLDKLFKQIKKMLTDPGFQPLVAEVLIVWNGERHVDETELGKQLVEFGKTKPLRISYPLKAGFPNDLMNRYHPRLEIKTKAIMYYDDDGPFYSYKATLGGFELWKRNANTQIGAMARKLDLGPRALDESKAHLNGPGDRFFVSQCPKDELDYNYREFANFGARMVLPSGSFLHANYLCFLWHPVFEEIRQYVKEHPTHPDDVTVSTLVSQLAGRAPKVYPRRVNEVKPEEDKGRRRLMEGIDWDKKGGHSQKKNWGNLRADAVNSLARYFGSINSGSIGWCYGTEYQKGEYCKPEFATVGMLSWMKPDHTPRDTCP